MDTKNKDIIPKGSWILIGVNPMVHKTAQGVIFQTDKDYSWGQLSYGEVIQAENGWKHDFIRHILYRSSDKIVKNPHGGNSHGKTLLNQL